MNSNRIWYEVRYKGKRNKIVEWSKIDTLAEAQHDRALLHGLKRSGIQVIKIEEKRTVLSED